MRYKKEKEEKQEHKAMKSMGHSHICSPSCINLGVGDAADGTPTAFPFSTNKKKIW